MSLGKCCISGYSHAGTPSGKIEIIGGTPVYVALPTGDYDKTKALLFLTDVFGLELENNKLLADDYAKNGFATYVPDYLLGDAIGKDALNDGTFDLMGWIGRHGKDVTRAPLDKVIAGLKAQGITSFAANGFCFGGRSAFELTVEHELKAVIFSHPSLLAIPSALELLKANSSPIPLLFQFAETDFQMGPEQQAIADKVFADDKSYNKILYKGVSHGFLVRGNLDNPAEKIAIEQGFKDAVNFLLAHL